MNKFSGDEFLKASEIGQYHYCSIAWLLQKQGYEPKSPAMKDGKRHHIILDEKITSLQEIEKLLSSLREGMTCITATNRRT